MEEIHKEVLVRCRKDLVHDLMMEVTWDHLIQAKVVTPDMKNSMLERAKQQHEQAASILLDHLPKRGPRAFDDFCMCLRDSGQGHLDELLQGTLEEVRKQDQEPPPTFAPNQQPPHGAAASPQAKKNVVRSASGSARSGELPQLLDVMDMPLYHQNSSDDLVMRIFHSSAHPASEIYRMTHSPRGRVLLIINSDYTLARNRGLNLGDREAADVDRLMLEKLFSQLQFLVRVCTDLTAKKLQEAVKDESKLDHSSFDCFICILSAHGVKEGIFGSDGEVVGIEDFFPLFDGQNCRSLVGKPKIFIIQSSRGVIRDTGVQLGSLPPTKVSPDDVTAELMMNNLAYASSLPGLGELGVAPSPSHSYLEAFKGDSPSKHPSMADFFIAYATPPGYTAFRNTEGGSWFLCALVIIFKEFSHTHSLTRMMTKVNHLLSRGQTANGLKQTCASWSTLTKELYFFPGLQE